MEGAGIWKILAIGLVLVGVHRIGQGRDQGAIPLFIGMAILLTVMKWHP